MTRVELDDELNNSVTIFVLHRLAILTKLTVH